MTGIRPRFPCPTCTRVVTGVRDRNSPGVVYVLSRHRRITRDGDTILGDAGWCPGSLQSPSHTPKDAT